MHSTTRVKRVLNPYKEYRNLGEEALKTLSVFHLYSDGNSGICSLFLDEVASLAGIDGRKLDNAIKTLIKHELLTKKRRKDKSVYYVVHVPV